MPARPLVSLGPRPIQLVDDGGPISFCALIVVFLLLRLPLARQLLRLRYLCRSHEFFDLFPICYRARMILRR